MQQDGALALAQAQHLAEHVDIGGQTDRLLGKPPVVLAGAELKDAQQILAMNLDELIDVVVDGTVVIEPVPVAVSRHELFRREIGCAGPGRRFMTATRHIGLQLDEGGTRPDQPAAGECHDVVDVATQIESRPQAENGTKCESGAHQIERARMRKPWRVEDRLVIERKHHSGHGRAPGRAKTHANAGIDRAADSD